MKPLLKSAAATDEDVRIWRRVCCSGFHVHRINCCAEGMALLSDRRDAALMFEAQRCRYRTFPVDMPPLELIGPAGVLVCGGAIFLPANPYPAAL